MFNLKSLEKADKYNFIIDTEKYGNALNWFKNVKEIIIGGENEDVKNLRILDQLDEDIEQAEINWLKRNCEHLIFDIQFEDKGYAFVDVLMVYDENDNNVFEKWFFGDGESQEFINMICE